MRMGMGAEQQPQKDIQNINLTGPWQMIQMTTGMGIPAIWQLNTVTGESYFCVLGDKGPVCHKALYSN